MTVTSRQSLEEQATTRTGLASFGGDGWQVGLDHLLDALETDLAGNATAVAVVEEIVLRRLANRLQVEAWYAEQGRDGPPALEGPLVILGLPRTATTALHYLLSVDPQFRYPRLWEMNMPVPPPDIATEDQDSRRLAGMSREGDVRHISSVDGPVEDGFIQALHFGGQELQLPVPRYSAWWRGVDLTGTFAYQERVLRLLHSRRPPYRWLLKTPSYLFHLPEMSEHYPDARFVMTHRDPVVAIPSTCSVVFEARSNVLPNIDQDKLELGPEMLLHHELGIRQAIEARTAIGEERFLDLSQEQVELDPIGTAERIYDFAGLDLHDDVKGAMGDWAAVNRRGSRGAHTYTAEEFGLRTNDIREGFVEYYERFAAFIPPVELT